MQRIRRLLWQLLKGEDGPTAVEYAVVIAMILLVCIGAVNSVGSAVSKSLQDSADLIGNATSGGSSGSGGSAGSGSAGSGSAGTGGSGSGSSGSGSGGGGKGGGKGGSKGKGR
jgi:Flp pilus assembly pilin Flp